MIESLTGRSRRTDVSFYRNGCINVSARIARLLELANGDVIDVGRAGREYYLYVRYRADEVTGKHAGCCFQTNRNLSQNFRAYSSLLCGRVLDIVGCSDIVRLAAGQSVEINGKKAVILIMRNQT